LQLRTFRIGLLLTANARNSFGVGYDKNRFAYLGEGRGGAYEDAREHEEGFEHWMSEKSVS